MLPKKNKKKNKKHGYHIMDIPKGTIGEPSKIVEEAMEIMDAHQQGVRIMAATEMGDLYGALDRYREKHHADLTMEDIHAMYMVTRRAFDSGRRT
jgi:phosphoribosyl-ATP pyrophosphohydrolase